MDSLTRDQAKEALLQGKTVAHNYYTSNEHLKLVDGALVTEDGCRHGGFFGEFWTKYQIWPDGWHIKN